MARASARAYSEGMTRRPTAIRAAPCAGSEFILPGRRFADAYQVPALDAMAATRLAFSHGPPSARMIGGVA
jgi:hypothetical protein